MRIRNLLVFCTLFVLAAMTLAAADVTGKWTAEVQGRQGNTRTVTFNLKQDGAGLTGQVEGMGPEAVQISDGKVSGDEISFFVKREFNGNEVKINYTGKMEGDTLKMKSQREGGDRTQEFTAKKVTI